MYSKWTTARHYDNLLTRITQCEYEVECTLPPNSISTFSFFFLGNDSIEGLEDVWTVSCKSNQLLLWLPLFKLGTGSNVSAKASFIYVCVYVCIMHTCKVITHWVTYCMHVFCAEDGWKFQITPISCFWFLTKSPWAACRKRFLSVNPFLPPVLNNNKLIQFVGGLDATQE